MGFEECASDCFRVTGYATGYFIAGQFLFPSHKPREQDVQRARPSYESRPTRRATLLASIYHDVCYFVGHHAFKLLIVQVFDDLDR